MSFLSARGVVGLTTRKCTSNSHPWVPWYQQTPSNEASRVLSFSMGGHTFCDVLLVVTLVLFHLDFQWKLPSLLYKKESFCSTSSAKYAKSSSLFFLMWRLRDTPFGWHSWQKMPMGRRHCFRWRGMQTEPSILERYEAIIFFLNSGLSASMLSYIKVILKF